MPKLEVICKSEEFLGEFEQLRLGPLVSLLERVRQNPPSELTVNALTGYSRESKDVAKELGLLFALMPPERIFEQFGEDALIWSWTQSFWHKEGLLEGIGRLTGKDKVLLEKARLAVWRFLKLDDASLILKTYRLISDMSPFIGTVDLPREIERFPARGVEISEERKRGYGLIRLLSEHYSVKGYEKDWKFREKDGGYITGLYIDAPVGIALTYENWPQVSMSFMPRDERTLTIYQLQGYSPEIMQRKDEDTVCVGKIHPRALAPLDFKALMIDIGEKTARHFDFSRLGFLGAVNSEWIKPKGGNAPHLTMERAVKKYDDVARSFGFRQEDDGNWYKEL